MRRDAPHRDLPERIARFAEVRRDSAALRRGTYRQILVQHEQLAFAWEIDGKRIVVAVNAAAEHVSLELSLHGFSDGRLVDLLEPGEPAAVRAGLAPDVGVSPRWGRIMTFEASSWAHLDNASTSQSR